MPGTVDNKQIYHLGVFIPFWILQLLGEILVIAFTALGIAALIVVADYESCYTDYYGQQSCYSYYDVDSQNLGLAAYGVGLGFSVVFLIMHIVQIALFGRKKLTPAANFGIELSRYIVWTAVIVLFIILAVYAGFLSLAVLVVAVVLWLLYLGTMIYSCVIFHRYRRGRYTPGGPYPHGAYPNGAYPNGAYPNMYQGSQYAPGPYQQPYGAGYPPPQGQYHAQSGHPPHPSQSPPPQDSLNGHTSPAMQQRESDVVT